MSELREHQIVKLYAVIRQIEPLAPESDVLVWAVKKGTSGHKDSFNDPYFIGSEFRVYWTTDGIEIRSRNSTPANKIRNKQPQRRGKPICISYEQLTEQIMELRAHRNKNAAR
jgi:hypothetical protein